MRRWLVEETEEKRAPKPGEWVLDLEYNPPINRNVGQLRWLHYPILRVTELPSDPPIMGMDEWW